jgi:hypothetical protein
MASRKQAVFGTSRRHFSRGIEPDALYSNMRMVRFGSPSSSRSAFPGSWK